MNEYASNSTVTWQHHYTGAPTEYHLGVLWQDEYGLYIWSDGETWLHTPRCRAILRGGQRPGKKDPTTFFTRDAVIAIWEKHCREAVIGPDGYAARPIIRFCWCLARPVPGQHEHVEVLATSALAGAR